LTTPKTTTRMDRGIALHRSRGHEICEVEPGIFRVPSCSGGGFYRVNLDAETCECPDRDPACKHMFAATIFTAKRTCRRVTADRPQRRHGQPRERQRDGHGQRRGNRSAPADTTTPRRSEEGSLRGGEPVSTALAGLKRIAD
jgi:hypothetical protein